MTNRVFSYIDPDGREKQFVVYVEQPKPGTRQQVVVQGAGMNFGHAFIGIRDTDNPKGEVKVGFYPKAGTSLQVGTGQTVDGEIKNNNQHSYNVEKAFTIGDDKYNALVNDVQKDAKDPPQYNLRETSEEYNCTDWVIDEAKVAGIMLPSHDVNTPADLGQDLISGGASNKTFSGPDQGSSDQEDPQKKSDLSALFALKPKGK